jgi:hypothetical protein
MVVAEMAFARPFVVAYCIITIISQNLTPELFARSDTNTEPFDKVTTSKQKPLYSLLMASLIIRYVPGYRSLMMTPRPVSAWTWLRYFYPLKFKVWTCALIAQSVEHSAVT